MFRQTIEAKHEALESVIFFKIWTQIGIQDVGVL